MLYMSHGLTVSLSLWEDNSTRSQRQLYLPQSRRVATTPGNYSSSQLRMKENIRSERPPHPLHRVSLLIKHKKKIEPSFPHLSEYLYDARQRIQGAHPETNHPYNNYSLLGMSKKGNFFTSANVTPGDQLNTQFMI